MTSDLSWLDGLAVCFFLLMLFGWGQIALKIGDGISLNASMHQVRRVWMQRMIERPDRIVDAALTGHTVSSLAFFSSANILIIAGLFGLLARADETNLMITAWHFAAASTTALVQGKILGLIGILAYGFFRFLLQVLKPRDPAVEPPLDL